VCRVRNQGRRGPPRFLFAFEVCTERLAEGLNVIQNRSKFRREFERGSKSVMKAVLSRDPGGPETLTLETVADPVPAKGEVLVAIKACGVNFPDSLRIQDLYQVKIPRPFSPGSEISGVVERLGEGVTGLKVGDRVMGSTGHGGMAEKVAAAAARFAIVPEGMSFEEAATFSSMYNTSYYALVDRASIAPGERLLVLGAGGGVGLAAVELGKALGAYVVAAASTADKLDAAKERGADETVLYPRGPFDRNGQKALAEQFKAISGQNGFDVVYDPIGGDYAEAALRSMARNGRFLVVGFTAGIPKIPLNLTLLKSCQIVGVFNGAFAQQEPEKSRANVVEIIALYKAGKIKPYVSKRYPLDKGPDAIALLAARDAVGKVVVTIG
jgi:NADPH2:quinone reductase